MEMEAATLPRPRWSTDVAAKPCSNSTSVQRGAAQQKAKKKEKKKLHKGGLCCEETAVA